MNMLEEIFNNTEKQLICATSEIIYKDGNYYFRSKEFPTYHGGNGIVVFNDFAFGNIDIYINLFRELFNFNGFINISFYSKNENLPNVISDLHTNFETTTYYFMQLLKSKKEVKYEIVTIIDFDELLAFEKKVEDNSWFHQEGFQKKLKITKDLNISWLGIKDASFVSVCGYFIYDNMIRLQDVQTDSEHLRMGMASSIISYINKIEMYKPIYVYVDASNEEAIGLYKSIGFEKIGNEVLEIKMSLT